MTIREELEAIAKEYRAERHEDQQTLDSNFQRSSAGGQIPEGGFHLVGLGELLSRPEVPTDWVLDGVLAAGTVSGVVAKPKVGKSTYARGLCLAVARGDEFLGRSTRQGSCIYVALEERGEEVTSDFRAMGADGSEPIEIHADAAPEAAMLSLVDLIWAKRPALVVLDPLIRIVRVKDEKAYAEVYTAMGPLIDVARETGTHILFTHHSGKALKGDPIDSPLGSTAISGSVSTLVYLKRTEDRRTFQTRQRIGQDVPETVLTFDTVTRSLSVGGTRLEADRLGCEGEIMDYLIASGGQKTEPEIVENVQYKTAVQRNALRSLVDNGAVTHTGLGKKGDPFKYSIACSRLVPGTEEQECVNDPQIAANTKKMLVPGNHEGQMLVPVKEEGQKLVPRINTGEDEPFFDVEV